MIPWSQAEFAEVDGENRRKDVLLSQKDMEIDELKKVKISTTSKKYHYTIIYHNLYVNTPPVHIIIHTYFWQDKSHCPIY